ncbi:hypothetical protein COOONC_21275 [Cooperia oncophora]
MYPTAPPDEAPPTYEEAKVHAVSRPEALVEQGGSQLDRPPQYDGERTLPRELEFLPKVEVTNSSKTCGCSVIRAQPGSEHDGCQTIVLCEECRREGRASQ